MADQNGALADQAIGAGGAGVERRAGNGHDLAALLPGHAGGDQRARTLGRLDHHGAPGEARDDAVAARKILGARLVAGGAFRNDQALFGDLAVKALVLRRVDMVDAAAEDGDRAIGEAGGMGLAVDAEGEAGDDGETGAAKFGGHVARDLAAGGGGIAGADNGDGVRPGEGGISQHGKQGRRRVERDQQFRKVRLAAGNDPCTAALGGGDLVLNGGKGGHLDAAALGNAACNLGQGSEGIGRIAEAFKQTRESQWADIRCTDNADPVAPLGIAEPAQVHSSGLAFGVPKRGSVPFRRRSMFALCVQKTSRESPASPPRMTGLRSPSR